MEKNFKCCDWKIAMKSEDQREAEKADEQGECAHLHTRDSNVRGYKRCMDCGKLIGSQDGIQPCIYGDEERPEPLQD
jgi:hypothetical protein